MTNYFVSRKYFYAIYSILLIVLGIICWQFSKEQMFFAVNSHHNTFFDGFFYLATELGNSWTYVIVIIVSLFFPRKYLFILLTGLAVSTLLAQGLKHFIFDDAARPLAYFQDNSMVHHLAGSARLMRHSFPSGHTVSAFALAAILVGFFTQRNFDLLLLFMAVLVAWSRVYLGQHFVGDVVFGSFLGVFSGTISVILWSGAPPKFEKPIIKYNFTNKK